MQSRMKNLSKLVAVAATISIVFSSPVLAGGSGLVGSAADAARGVGKALDNLDLKGAVKVLPSSPNGGFPVKPTRPVPIPGGSKPPKSLGNTVKRADPPDLPAGGIGRFVDANDLPSPPGFGNRVQAYGPAPKLSRKPTPIGVYGPAPAEIIAASEAAMRPLTNRAASFFKRNPKAITTVAVLSVGVAGVGTAGALINGGDNDIADAGRDVAEAGQDAVDWGSGAVDTVESWF